MVGMLQVPIYLYGYGTGANSASDTGTAERRNPRYGSYRFKPTCSFV